MTTDTQTDLPLSLQPGAMSALLDELFRTPEEASSQEEPALRPGERVGRFEILGELGRGGFGVVYEARDLELGRTVAFKVVRPGRRTDVREERLLLEAEAAARLCHPNIVTLFDLGRSAHGPYLVLELLRGTTVGDLLTRGPLPREEALLIATEVARGLAHAHAAGVVHRDLSPGNVFVCDDGRVKVLDLGMAHAFGRDKVDGGTPGFMAPEQREGLPEDARTDVFALGALLLVMLGLRPPADGCGPGERLARVIRRMLARSPEARQRDAGVALEDLLALQPEREAQRRFRRLVAAMLLAAVAGGGALWHRSTRPVTVKLDGQSIAVLPFEDLSPGKERTTVAAGLAAEIHDALAEVRGLRVAGHGSAVRTRGLDVREAASKLQVSSVLKGTLRSHGEGLEVVVRLLRGADARELWSRTFAVSTEAGAFEIQKAIASALIQALGLQQASSTAGAADRPPLPDAYARYLRARSVYGAEGTDDADAIADLRAAVQLDPSFARAWTLLGNAIYTSLPYGPIETETAYAERCNGALGALDRALALDSHLGEAYSSRGYVRVQCNMDWDGATADLARGLELEPGSAEAWRRSGVTELYRARLEPALRSLRRAVDLDPLLTKNWTWLARVYWGLGRYAEARAAVDRTLAMTPSSWVVVLPAFFDLEEGRPAEALEQFKKATSVNQRMRGQALALWDLGRKDEARAVVAEMIRQDLVLPYGLAQIHSWWGENDRALEALERQLASRKYPSIEARWDPLLRKLHADPRFWVLLRRAGFPE